MSNFSNRKSFEREQYIEMLRADGGIKMRKVTTQLAALALLLASGSAFAWQCDFLTGGGFIFFNGNKANFGVGGGCKHGSPTWGWTRAPPPKAGRPVPVACAARPGRTCSATSTSSCRPETRGNPVSTISSTSG